MPREYGRNRRVADLIQRELAAVIQRELDPARTGMVTVSGTDVSPDLTQARVYFTRIGGCMSHAELAAELNGMAGHFRHHLARSLTMRSVPRLEFRFDESVERGSRMSELIDSLTKDKAQSDRT
jgi:ribosome-binding factor A